MNGYLTMLLNNKLETKLVGENGVAKTNESDAQNNNPNPNHTLAQDSTCIKSGTINTQDTQIIDSSKQDGHLPGEDITIAADTLKKDAALPLTLDGSATRTGIPAVTKGEFQKRPAAETDSGRRSMSASTKTGGMGKRSKAGYEIVLTQIPKHADLKIVKGAIRARIGKFKCVRCEMYRHGMCKIWVRKPETRDKILNNAIYIFGVQIIAGLKATESLPSDEEEEQGDEELAAVHLSNIPPSCTVKKLMGMVKQIVGDFVACNRVVIEKGTSKIIFKWSKHQKTLLKNGFGGELSNVVISAATASPPLTPGHTPGHRTPGHRTPGKLTPGKLTPGKLVETKFETKGGMKREKKPVVSLTSQMDAMSCSDSTSASVRSTQNNRSVSRMSISGTDHSDSDAWYGAAAEAKKNSDVDSSMSWSDMVSRHSNTRPSNNAYHQQQAPLASTQAEAAAELMFAQNNRHNGGRRRRKKVNRMSSISASYLMLENEKLRMEIELMRMQKEEQQRYANRVHGYGYQNHGTSSPTVGIESQLEDYCSLPLVRDCYDYQTWLDQTHLMR